MSSKISTTDLSNRIALGGASRRDLLLQAAEAFRTSPRFAMPAAIRDIDPEGVEVVVFGSIFFAQNFMYAANARGLRVLAVVDDYRLGLECGGKPIITSSAFLQLAGRHPNLVAVNCGRTDRATRHFERLSTKAGVPMVSFEQGVRLFNLSAAIDQRLADWGPLIAARTAEYLRLEDVAADEYSKETLYGVLMFHLTGSMEWILSICRPYTTLYFRTDLFSLRRGERFVDCGASIGESTGGVLALTHGDVGRVWMIDPDKHNQAKLDALIAEQSAQVRERLSLHRMAVGPTEGRMPFSHVGGHGGSIVSDFVMVGEVDEVDINPIDAIIDQPPTLIKMDIEGAELGALKGATRAIREGRPIMTISAYHRATDLIDLPAFVAGLDAGYRIGLRHHTEERWDTCLYFLPQ